MGLEEHTSHRCGPERSSGGAEPDPPGEQRLLPSPGGQKGWVRTAGLDPPGLCQLTFLEIIIKVKLTMRPKRIQTPHKGFCLKKGSLKDNNPKVLILFSVV